MHKLRQLLNKNINRVQIRYAGKSRGDTMVEVIVSSAIIILALAGSYAISHRSLQQGTSSGLRSQALSAAQDQIEHIRNAYLKDPSRLIMYKQAAPYCILSNGLPEFISEGNEPECQFYNGSKVSVRVDYDSGIFTASAFWPSATSDNDQDQLFLYYKLTGAGGASGTSSSGPPPPSSSTSSSQPPPSDGCAGNPPSVTTLQADSITHSSARVFGSINPNGSATTYYFKYGKTTNYGLQTSSKSAGSGTSPIIGYNTLFPLDSATTYHYNIVATNACGSVSNGDRTFTTLNDGGSTTSTSTTTTSGGSTSTSSGSTTSSGGGPCIQDDGWAGPPGDPTPDPCIRKFDPVGGTNFDLEASHCYAGAWIAYDDGQKTLPVDGDGGIGGTFNAGGPGSGIYKFFCAGDGGAISTRDLGGGGGPPPPEDFDHIDTACYYPNDGSHTGPPAEPPPCNGSFGESEYIRTGCFWNSDNSLKHWEACEDGT